MSVSQIKAIAIEIATEILEAAKSGSLDSVVLKYDTQGKPIGDLSRVYSHSGIYVFTIEKEGALAASYVGKCENDGRLRQHITGKNLNGTPLKPSVGRKYDEILETLGRGFTVRVNLYSNEEFDKSSLSCIEIKALEIAKQEFKNIFPREKHWIQRIG